MHTMPLTLSPLRPAAMARALLRSLMVSVPVCVLIAAFLSACLLYTSPSPRD